MTMAAVPMARRHPPSRKCRVSREHLTLVPAHVTVRSVARRRAIPPGQPAALSWEVTPWEYDDHAWYLTSVHRGLSCRQVAELMGISKTRVQQIEVEAVEKLRLGLADVFARLGMDSELEPDADLILGIFALHDRRRHEEALERERALTELDCVPPRAL